MLNREFYRSAMRCLRAARTLHEPVAYSAAVRMVRSVTGRWDIPLPVSPWEQREVVNVQLPHPRRGAGICAARTVPAANF